MTRGARSNSWRRRLRRRWCLLRRIRDVKVLGDQLGTTALHLAVHVSNVVLSECPWTRSLTAHARIHLTHQMEYFTYLPHTFRVSCRISDLNSLQTNYLISFGVFFFNTRETLYKHGKNVQTLHILLPPHLLSLPGQNKRWKCWKQGCTF